MSSITEQKAALRLYLRQEQAKLDPSDLQGSDQQIAKHLLGLAEWKAAHIIFLYLSVGKEPDTWIILKEAWREGKRVAVPRCQPGGIMEAREISSLQGLVPRSFGILEPDESHPLISPGELDLVIAPCLAADGRLHRLGHGAGYYDRYLPRVRCPILCLCRGVFLLEKLPADELDAPVDRVITEAGVFPTP